MAEGFGNVVQFLIVYNNDADGEDVLRPMYSEYGSTRLILLSVTHRTGQALKRYIASQSEEVIDAGGPFIGFNNLPPEGILTVEDLQNYVLSALGLFFLFVSLSGCVLIWVGRRQVGAARIILVAGEIPVVSSSSSSRRLLTEAQIQQLAQAQRQEVADPDEAVGAASLTTVSHQDDCCAVCMEDFEQDADQSDENISLPCGHLFHKDCTLLFYVLLSNVKRTLCFQSDLLFVWCVFCRRRSMVNPASIKVPIVQIRRRRIPWSIARIGTRSLIWYSRMESLGMDPISLLDCRVGTRRGRVGAHNQ